MTELAATLDAPAPPKNATAAAQALWWIAKGGYETGEGWTRAHEICQDHEGQTMFDRIHGLAHLIEGDRANAAYWYRRAGTELPDDIGAEWTAIAAIL